MQSKRKKLMAFVLALVIVCGTMQGGRLPVVAEATSGEAQDAGKAASDKAQDAGKAASDKDAGKASASETKQKGEETESETETEESSDAKQTELPSETAPEKDAQGSENASAQSEASKGQETSESGSAAGAGTGSTTGTETGSTTGTETGSTTGTEPGSTTGTEPGSTTGTETGGTTGTEPGSTTGTETGGTTGTETGSTIGTEPGNTTSAETGDTTATEPDAGTEETGETESETAATMAQSGPEQVKALFQALLLNYVGAALPADLQSEEADRAIRQAVLEMDQETLTRCYEQALAAMEFFDTLTEEEAVVFAETEPGLYQAVMNSLGQALAAVMNGEIEPMSLLPLEERNAYLVLSGYSEEQIKAMPLGTVLDSLRDSDGNKIGISESATTVWTYFKDENDQIIRDEYHVIGRDETVDLSLFVDVNDYRMELIIGSGKQLDAANIRYLVKVYISTQITEELSYELYTQDDAGNRTKIVPDRVNTSVNTQIPGFSIETTLYSVSSHVQGKEYYLGIRSVADEHPDIKTEIYTFSDYLLYMQGNTGAPTITAQILNQNMQSSGAGYRHTFDAPSGVYDPSGIFAVVYKHAESGQQVGQQMIAFAVKKDVSYITGMIYDEQKANAVCYMVDSYDVDFGNLDIDFGTGQVSGNGVQGLYYMLNGEYAPDSEYYCMLKAHGTDYGDDANSYVTKAVVGFYNSLDEAQSQPDIKDQLIPADASQAVSGYKANYYYKNGGQNFTIFFEDDSVFKVNVRIADYQAKYDENYVKEFTDAPIVGDQDPWFRVTGANMNGQPLDTYVVENGKEINMDTMYGYGYQTVFIRDENADLSQLQPTFWTANPDRVKVRVASDAGKDVVSGVTVTDFSGGTVMYTAQLDRDDPANAHQKQYQVNFVKKSKAPQLYVVGPREREVFLDEYFEYKHDILIGNMGEETLTGLKVELNATNVKLDDYWTVGGNGNDTLAGFSTTSSDKEYGELPNLAKIRLLPDGDGEITGTVTISADGQEPVVIALNGRAQNPKIITEKLDDAVKYVPYSYWISTNNMYDWTKVTYTLTGTLPAGVEWYPATGEIYGVPQETGAFPIHIDAEFTSDSYTFESSGVDLTLNVLDNTNVNVYEASDTGYIIEDSVGTDAGGYDYVLEELSDQIFRSSGELTDFIDLWLNGEKLVNGVDYTAVSGSTKITIIKQTFDNRAKKDGTNTLAAEFRVGGDKGNELKRTAQNFRIKEQQSTEQPPTEKPTPSTEQPPTEKPTPSTEQSSTEKPTPSTEQPPTEQPTPSTEQPTPSTEAPTPSTEQPSTQAPTPSTEMPDTEKPQKDQTETDETDETEKKTEKASEENHYVAMSVAVLDQEEKAMPGVTVEIHSTVQSAVADENGVARFENVEFGTHIVTVKDANGETLAAKNFEIASGSSVSLSGNTITAQQGANVYLKVKIQNGELLLVSAGSEADAPKTGDPTNLTLWLTLALLSASAFCLAWTKRRNRAR